MPRRIRRQTGMTSLTRKESHGQTAPYHMNTEMLRSMSMVGCKESSWVSSLNLENISCCEPLNTMIHLPVVPSKCVSSHEAGQHIIRSNHTTSTSNEECHCDSENQEAFPINKFSLFSKMQ